MAATRASGTNAVRYGTMRENVLGLTVVTADGRDLSTGGRARKSAAGYDLTRLFVGSEGTLGIITEVPAAAARHPRGDLGGGLPVRRPRRRRRHGDRHDPVRHPGRPRSSCSTRCRCAPSTPIRSSTIAEAPTLFFEFHGTPAGVEEQARTVGELAEGFGGGAFRWATRPEDRNRLWEARHDAYWAAMALRPGAEGKATDVCVPISRLAECDPRRARRRRGHGLVAPIVGHVGDGNFHMTFLLDPNDPAEVARGRGGQRAAGRAGARHGRHLHRRARRRLGKMRYLEAGARRGGRADAHDQARARPAEHPEPGKIFRLDPKTDSFPSR